MISSPGSNQKPGCKRAFPRTDARCLWSYRAGRAGGHGDKEVRRQGHSLVDAGNVTPDAGCDDEAVPANT